MVLIVVFRYVRSIICIQSVSDRSDIPVGVVAALNKTANETFNNASVLAFVAKFRTISGPPFFENSLGDRTANTNNISNDFPIKLWILNTNLGLQLLKLLF